MAQFSQKIGRKMVYWTDHSLDRWWERCEDNDRAGRQECLTRLRERLSEHRIERDLPAWGRVSLFHRARAEGFLYIDDDSGFIINRNANGDFVAVTYIEREQVFA
jgi:hypothetical protein